MMPSWVLALAWLLIFKNDRIAGEKGMITSLFGITPPDWFSYGFFPIIICLGLHYYAYSFLLVSGALRTVDSQLEEAGAIAGLKKGAVLRKITFPIVLPAGSETIITVQSGSINLAVKINGFTGIKMDDLLWLNFDPEKMNYYDIETERLIQA